MGIKLKTVSDNLSLGGQRAFAVEEIYIGAEEPIDGYYKIWVNPEGEDVAEIATKDYVDEAIRNIDISDIEVDLTGYATEEYVNSAIETIELTPGEPGEDGYTPVKGVDYYTEEDKAELVQDVLAALPAAESVGV